MWRKNDTNEEKKERLKNEINQQPSVKLSVRDGGLKGRGVNCLNNLAKVQILVFN